MGHMEKGDRHDVHVDRPRGRPLGIKQLECVSVAFSQLRTRRVLPLPFGQRILPTSKIYRSTRSFFRACMGSSMRTRAFESNPHLLFSSLSFRNGRSFPHVASHRMRRTSRHFQKIPTEG